NADDPRVGGMRRDTAATVLTFGRARDADVRLAEEAVEDARGLAFSFETRGVRQAVSIAFAGRHNVGNALAAATAGIALGLGPDEIARGLAAARPVAGRCVWRPVGGVRILDDTYNANPVSVAAALDTVRAHRGSSRL